MNWELTGPVLVALITFIIGPIIAYLLKRRELIDARYANEQLRGELANARRKLPLPSILSKEEYGITIESPTEYENVGESFKVSGGFKNLPEGQCIWVSTFGVYDDGSGKKRMRYWPQEQAVTHISSEGKRWKGIVHNIGGQWSNQTKEYIVFVVGIEGQALFNYFKYAGSENKQWPPICYALKKVDGKLRCSI